ncbi:TIGR02757 family protein [Candidatus Latescibacterota bacterium]
MADSHKLKHSLDILAEKYGAGYLDSDPVGIVHRYESDADREVAGFIASSLAYGGAGQIRKSVETILSQTGQSPADFARSLTFESALKSFPGFKHRWTDGGEIAYLFLAVGRILNEYGSVGDFVKTLYDSEDETIFGAMTGFSEWIANNYSEDFSRGSKRSGISYLVPSPANGSACKRLALYFRWMVRGPDNVDFGIWDFISASKLVIPVDRHIARMGTLLGLTSRKSPDWKMAVEITESLKRFDPDDPVRYDFALVRPGILGDCNSLGDGKNCEMCELVTFCTAVEPK